MLRLNNLVDRMEEDSQRRQLSSSSSKVREMFRLEDFEEREEEEGPQIWESNSSKAKTSSLPLGRALNILFNAQLKELEKDLAVKNDSHRGKQGMVSRATFSLIQHVKDTNSKGLSLEHTCIPILEHAVKFKEPSYRKKSAAILRWLLEIREVEMAVASTLKDIIGASQGENRVKLGWCVLIRDLVSGWSGKAGLDTPLHSKTFDILVSCVPQLVHIVCMASVTEDKKRIPTRLTAAAADCLLMITKCLATGPPAEADVSSKVKVDDTQQKRSLITPVDSTEEFIRRQESRGADLTDINNSPTTSGSELFNNSKNREIHLWEYLDNLISFVRELEEWNKRIRPLFTRGLQFIQMRLQVLANYRDNMQCSGDAGVELIGAAVLAACWQHYSGLIFTEDKKLSSHPQLVLEHWLDALQFYMQQAEGSDTEEENKKALEMRGFALACIALILGRLDARHLEMTLAEYEGDLLKAMFGQLHGSDSIVVELAVVILRAILFRPSSSTAVTVQETPSASRMESIIPMLLEMLDKQDATARAVVLLVAEYFALHPESLIMEQLFSRLDSEESGHRKNALDVLTELLSICTRSADTVNSSLSQTIAKHIFKRLGDAELTNRVEASAIFAKLDSSFTLPTLLELLYSRDGRIRSAASAGVLCILKGQPNSTRVINELLDCVTKMTGPSQPVQNAQPGVPSDGGRKSDERVDVDRVMRLIPDWATTVEDWQGVIHLVLSKMFEEPANSVIPRFLSCISNQLADQRQILLPLLLDKMQNQPKITPGFLAKLLDTNSENNENDALRKELFSRLSPLLALRVLPLKVFDDPSCKELYGGSPTLKTGDGALNASGEVCITSLLMDRVCGGYEFEDVRKVASELTGRLLPDVESKGLHFTTGLSWTFMKRKGKIMIPLVTGQLEAATNSHDLPKAKACIFILCNCLAIRGQEPLKHPLMGQIFHLLTSILLWQWSQEDKGYSDVAKAQHGCIDFFAIVICAELQSQRKLPVSEEKAVDPPIQRSQTNVLDESPPPQEAARSSKVGQTIVKFIEELPETEQLNGNLKRQQILGEEISVQEEIRSEPLKMKPRPPLIQVLSESEVGQHSVKEAKGSVADTSILSSIIDCLTGHMQRLPWPAVSLGLNKESPVVTGQSCRHAEAGSAKNIVPLSFRVCMANVLISACQKVSVGERSFLATQMIPPLITFIQVSNDSKLRGTCLVVLFNAVYNLKSASVLPFAVDLLNLSTTAIKSRYLLEERVGGAKLLTALLGAEEVLVTDLAPHLTDVQLALQSISSIDSSPEFRMICEKLLSCLSPDVF